MHLLRALSGVASLACLIVAYQNLDFALATALAYTTPLWVIARMPTQPKQISICGNLNGQYFEDISYPGLAQGSDTLATLWARKKIESLEDSLVFGADPDQIREMVTDVALDFGLLTSHTSLVAVDRTPVRPQDGFLESGNVPSLLPAGSSQTVNFSATATGWKTQLFLSLLTLLIATWMVWSADGRPVGLKMLRSGWIKSAGSRSRSPLADSTHAAR